MEREEIIILYFYSPYSRVDAKNELYLFAVRLVLGKKERITIVTSALEWSQTLLT